MKNSIAVGPVSFSATTFAAAVAAVANSAKEPLGAVRLANAWCVVVANEDEAYRRLLDGPGINLPDGSPVAGLVRRRSPSKAERVRCLSPFRAVLDEGRPLALRHFMLGTVDDTLARLCNEIEEAYPGVNICGTWAPPFGPVTEELISASVKTIRESGAAMVWVGMGSPSRTSSPQDRTKFSGDRRRRGCRIRLRGRHAPGSPALAPAHRHGVAFPACQPASALMATILDRQYEVPPDCGAAMRIAIVHSYYSSAQPSGENVVVDLQADALRRAGHEVRVIGARTDEKSKEFAYSMRSAVRASTGLGASPSRQLLEFEPHVVHVHNLFPNFGSRWLEQWDGPVVATLHNFRSICPGVPSSVTVRAALFVQTRVLTSQWCMPAIGIAPLQRFRSPLHPARQVPIRRPAASRPSGDALGPRQNTTPRSCTAYRARQDCHRAEFFRRPRGFRVQPRRVGVCRSTVRRERAR